MPLAAATSLAVCPAAGALALTRLDSCCPSSVTSTVEPSAKVYVFQALPFAEVGLPFLSSVAVEPIGVPRPRLASFASRALVLAPPVVAGTVGVACGPGNAPVAVFGRDAGRGVAVGEPATGVPSALMALPWASTQVRVPSGSVPTEAPAGKGMSGHPPSDQRVLAGERHGDCAQQILAALLGALGHLRDADRRELGQRRGNRPGFGHAVRQLARV